MALAAACSGKHAAGRMQQPCTACSVQQPHANSLFAAGCVAPTAAARQLLPQEHKGRSLPCLPPHTLIRRSKYRLDHLVRVNMAGSDKGYTCVYQTEDDNGARGGGGSVQAGPASLAWERVLVAARGAWVAAAERLSCGQQPVRGGSQS